MADPRCPHKDSHDVIAADPALVFLVREDTPLCDTLDELFVTQMPLNDQLALLNPMWHRALIIDSHRLHNISKLQTLSNIFPLLVFLVLILQNERLSTVDFHKTALIHGGPTRVTAIFDLFRGWADENRLLFRPRVYPCPHPIYQAIWQTRITTQVKAAQRLRFA